MRGWALGFLFCGLALAGEYPACPDLSGTWSCQLYVNGGEEPIFETIRITQKKTSDGSVEYDIGGDKLTLRWDRETEILPGRKARCLGESALIFWYEGSGSPYHQTITRGPSDFLRADQIRLRPKTFENNVVSRICRLKG